MNNRYSTNLLDLYYGYIQKGMVSIMSKYTGLECPVCKNTFKDNDDIVVCPECGAPYHRTCYQKEGHCIYEDKHGTDQAWQAEEHVHQEAGDKMSSLWYGESFRFLILLQMRTIAEL